MNTWLKLKPLFSFTPSRIDPDAIRRAKAEQAKGALVVAYIPGDSTSLAN